MPASETTAMSVVPPPMSTIMLPVGSVMGRPGADGGRHRLVDQVDLAGLRAQRAFAHRAAFDLGDLGRHADDDSWPHPAVAAVGAADEVGEHALGGLEVRDDAVAHRPDGHQVARRAADHLAGLGADGFDAVLLGVVGDDGGLVEDDAAAGCEDAGVCGAEVDSQIGAEPKRAK